MAIEVSRFSSVQGRDLTLIKKWFDTNASQFFDSTEVSENELLLKKGGAAVMSLSPQTAYTIKIYVNENITLSPTNGSAYYISKLAKTPHGIAVGFAGTSNSGELPYSLFVSKTDKGNIGMVVCNTLGVNLLTSAVFFESVGGTFRTKATAITPSVAADDVTTLTPVICEGSGGEYMPDCFFTSFSQYRGVECIFTADGSEYLYNGFIAMR